MDIELISLTFEDAASQIKSKALSPVELTQAYLDQINRFDSELNAFIRIDPDVSLAQAREAQEAIRRGEYLGPLHGIPVALKDLFETKDIVTTAGSLIRRDYVPKLDCAVVERLRQAGAVLLGKLNMHEWALGVTNENPHYGSCKNPWGVDRITGGSSGGSAAALAANMCLGSMGSDTGGSIRIPASLCGIVGLKPTYGRVSLRGVVPLSWNLDHAGPMARCVRDIALLLACVAGYDSEDPFSVDKPVQDYVGQVEKNDVAGWRIAIASDDYHNEVDNEIAAAVRKAAGVFEELGARVEEVDFSVSRETARASGFILLSDAAAFHQEHLENNSDSIGKDVLSRLRDGQKISATRYALARRSGMLLRRQFIKFFEEYDVLLTPTTPIPAPEFGADAVERARLLTRFTSPFNLTGLPALSLPCGITSDGLPIGLQIISRPWAEEKVLIAGQAYEDSTEWHKRHPAIFA